MKRKSVFTGLTLLFTLLICYLILVIGNIFLQRIYNNAVDESNSEAINIENTRYELEDKIQINKSKEEGFLPVLPPVFFDFPKRLSPLNELSRTHAYTPLGAQPNEKVYYCNEGYGLIRYMSDRYGFRNPDDLWDEEYTEIILIGDSFVHGACVEEEHTFRGHISKSYPRTINLGMSGSGPNNYSRTAQYFVKKNNPKKVITFFFANDNEGKYLTIFKKDFYPNQHYLLDDGNEKKLKQFYRKASEVALQSSENRNNSKNNLRERLQDDFKLELIRQLITNSPQESVKRTIDDVIGLCKIYSCEPYFVYLPTSSFWRPDSRQDGFRESIRKHLNDEYNLSENFYDASETKNKLGDEMFAPKGPHYSHKGYELISEEILKMISK